MPKLRNVAAKMPRKLQAACLAEVRAISPRPRPKREAVKAFRRWAGRWQAQAPDAVTCLAKDLNELLAFFACPPQRTGHESGPPMPWSGRSGRCAAGHGP